MLDAIVRVILAAPGLVIILAVLAGGAFLAALAWCMHKALSIVLFPEFSDDD